MNNRAKYKTILMVSGLTLIALGFAWKQSFFVTEKSTAKKINYSEKLENFPVNTQAGFNVITNDNIYSYQSLISNNANLINDVLAKDITSKSDVYLLQTTAQLSDTNFVDVEFNINKISNEITVSLAGFPLQSKAYLNINNAAYIGNTPVDWAGNIEFNVTYDENLTNKNICLIVEGITPDKISSLCHHIVNQEKGVQS